MLFFMAKTLLYLQKMAKNGISLDESESMKFGPRKKEMLPPAEIVPFGYHLLVNEVTQKYHEISAQPVLESEDALICFAC